MGVAELSQLPPDSGYEVAFAGRSNVGKSSAINAIVGQRSLARVSKRPGRTQQINFFPLDEARQLVDLPGYGYAKVSIQQKRRWQKLLGSYLQTRQALRGLVLVMDIRHPLTPFDEQLLSWCREVGMPAHLLLTKADKLSRGAAHNVLHQVRGSLNKNNSADEVTLQLFSASKQRGVEEAHVMLDSWFEL